jgi:hypothetical protein
MEELLRVLKEAREQVERDMKKKSKGKMPGKKGKKC